GREASAVAGQAGQSLTPADTRSEGPAGVTGVTGNGRAPGNPGVFRVGSFCEAAALTAELCGPACPLILRARAGRTGYALTASGVQQARPLAHTRAADGIAGESGGFTKPFPPGGSAGQGDSRNRANAPGGPRRTPGARRRTR